MYSELLCDKVSHRARSREARPVATGTSEQSDLFQVKVRSDLTGKNKIKDLTGESKIKDLRVDLWTKEN
jgi:hypothetical protein